MRTNLLSAVWDAYRVRRNVNDFTLLIAQSSIAILKGTGAVERRLREWQRREANWRHQSRPANDDASESSGCEACFVAVA